LSVYIHTKICNIRRCLSVGQYYPIRPVYIKRCLRG